MTEVKGELTAELALKLTFIMWEDMAEEEKKMGRKLDGFERWNFKRRWFVERGFVNKYGDCNVYCFCLLCEYKETNGGGCGHCLVDWSKNLSNTCTAAYAEDGGLFDIDYESTPADEFLEYMKTHIRKDVN